MDSGVFHRISYGLYLVCSKKSDGFNGQVANSVFQVTSEPRRIAISINRGNLTHEFIEESGVFSVSILSKDAPLSIIRGFGFRSGRDVDKFKGVEHRVGMTGAPIVLSHALGYLEALVTDSMDLGSHSLFVGEVVDAEIISEEEPMTYAYYHRVKRGSTREPVKQDREVRTLDKYECTACGYVYNPEEGDPDADVSPGTPFEELPDDWTCPLCGVDKDMFEKV